MVFVFVVFTVKTAVQRCVQVSLSFLRSTHHGCQEERVLEIQNSEFKIQNSEFKIQNTKFKIF